MMRRTFVVLAAALLTQVFSACDSSRDNEPRGFSVSRSHAAALAAEITPTTTVPPSAPVPPFVRSPSSQPLPPAPAQPLLASVPLPPGLVLPADLDRVAPNQPAGYDVYTSRDFRSKASSSQDHAGSQGWDAWLESRYKNLSQISDSSATGSPPSVMRYTFPAGLVSGNGPASMMYKITDETARSVYVSTWVRFSPNWEHHTKIYYVNWNGGSYIIRVNSRRSSTGLQVSVRPNHRGFLRGPTNIGTGKKGLHRGKWHLIEFIMKLSSTPNAPDGEVKVWIDGALAANRTAWRLPGTPPFSDVKFSPIYGGTNRARVPVVMTMDVDHVVVAGR